MRRVLGLAALLLVLAAPAGAGAQEPGGSWRAAADAPLSARTGATAVWTGREVLVAGGTRRRCPPDARCRPSRRPPLADGAAYDPAADAWRPIAPAPVPFGAATTAVVGDTVYVLTPGAPYPPDAAPPAFMAYSVAEDRWRRLGLSPRAPALALVAAGGRLLATGGGVRPVAYDPASGAWAPLAGIPFAARHPLQLVWTGERLVAMVCVGRRAPPCALRAAARDPATGAWRRLPDPPRGTLVPSWAALDGLVVNPDTDGVFARRFGGILDPATSTWSALPPAPRGRYGIGAFTARAASYFAEGGLALDLARRVWVRVPGRPSVSGEAVVAAGRDLFVFGGGRYDRGRPDGALLDDARLWSPPSA